MKVYICTSIRKDTLAPNKSFILYTYVFSDSTVYCIYMGTEFISLVCITVTLGPPLFRMYVSLPVALLLQVHTDDVCSGALPEELSCIEKERASHCYLPCCAWSLPREEVSYIATSHCDCDKIMSNNSIH